MSRAAALPHWETRLRPHLVINNVEINYLNVKRDIIYMHKHVVVVVVVGVVVPSSSSGGTTAATVTRITPCREMINYLNFVQK